MTTRRRRMREDLQLRGLAPKTQPWSVEAVRHRAQDSQRAPDQLSEAELRRSFRFRRNEKTVAESPFRMHLSGIRFFDERTRQRPWPVFDLIRPRHRHTRPVVLRPPEVRQLRALVNTPNARMGLRRIDAGGRRRREGTPLQVSDIDPQRRLVRVRRGTGGKDR